MLPAIDDGAPDLETALKMAQIAVQDGITHSACTPHIYPGLFENTAEGIYRAVDDFRKALAQADIPLEVTSGADVQITPEMIEGLDNKRIPTLHNSQYFLFEPPHHISPPGMLNLIHDVLASGYIPVITHPERLSYIDQDYDLFVEAAHKGAWMQLTAGSLTGNFGKRVQKVSERFLKDGITHLLASDAHNLKNRAPILSHARDVAARHLGQEEADLLVIGRPGNILQNIAPDSVVPPPGLHPDAKAKSRKNWLNLKGALPFIFRNKG